MEEQLSLDFLRVVENAAIAAARTMGFGDRNHADEVAVEAMRETMDSVEIDGTIVIGEGERDEAPMLYIGEKGGMGTHAPKALFPQVDIAVDPLEGTNLCATGAANARAVLAADGRGAALLERADSCEIGGQQAGTRGTTGKNGREGSEARLRHRRSGAGEENDFCMHGRDGRKLAEGRAVFRGRRAHKLHDSDAGRAAGALHRFGAPGEAAGHQGAVQLKLSFSIELVLETTLA